MNNLDKQIKKTLADILDKGTFKPSRTGVGTYSLPGCFIRHDMSDGFPISTLRKVPFKSPAIELEGFIKGVTSKSWYKERGCKYWNYWCNPQKVEYGTDENSKAKMEAEDDLGFIYGYQMRNFSDPSKGSGVDQLANVVKTLKYNPYDRRMVVMYWNPLALEHQALPACHLGWVVSVAGGYINLTYFMRSCDFLLGNNLNSYGLLLHLLSLESGFKPGILSAVFHDNHIYENQIEAATELANSDYSEDLPNVVTRDYENIFNWSFDQTKLINYNPDPNFKTKIPIAV